jgi:hypothetical protein
MKYIKKFRLFENLESEIDLKELEGLLIDFKQMGLEYDIKTGSSIVIDWNLFNQSSSVNPPSYSISFLGGSGCSTITQPQNMTQAALKEAIKIRSELYGVDGKSTYANGYSSANPANGGRGGMGLYLICRVLVFNGVISLTGGNGSSSYFSSGATLAGGGGGGGSVIISAETILQNTGTINTSGGSGVTSVSPVNNCKTSNGGNGGYLIIDR